MKNKKYIWVGLTVLLIIILGGGAWFYFFVFGADNEKMFEVKPSFLKITMKQGEISTNKIMITNYNEQDFSIKANGFSDYVSFGEPIIEGNEYSLDIIFNTVNATPGIYLGNLEIFNGENKKISIILEIQSKIVVFDSNINIYPSGDDFVPGQRLSAEIKIYDLASIGKKNLEITYFVKNFEGGVIISEVKDRIIDGKLDYSESLNLPEELELGEYVLGVVVKFVDKIGTESIGTSTLLFRVVEPESGKELSDKNIILIIVVFGFFFLVFLVFLFYTVFYRDRLLKELQNQYKKELRRQRKLIKGEEKRVYVKLKTPVEQKEYKKEVEQVKKKRIKALGEIKKKKIKEFKSIKKKYKGLNLKKQLQSWKRKGYDTSVLEKYKMPSAESIKEKIKEWNKKGYDTSVLQKK